MTLPPAKYKDLKKALYIFTHIYFSLLGIAVEQISNQNEKTR